ncbi:unnamed protein product [Orchesella dallaii]|uniref:Uncharacterized protein n=1 Tax=Orchesella dallaii TaxID=48710 RepID=A0ABP1RVX4_9HEXA
MHFCQDPDVIRHEISHEFTLVVRLKGVESGNIDFRTYTDFKSRVSRDIESVTLQEEQSHTLIYRISSSKYRWSNIFQIMEKITIDFSSIILDYKIRKRSLQDVFNSYALMQRVFRKEQKKTTFRMINFSSTTISLSIIFVLAVTPGLRAQLSSEAVSEGPCIANLTDYLADINPAWLFAPRNYYVPVASEGCYRNYAEVVLGRPAQNAQELNDMQLRIAFADGTALPKLYTYGYTNDGTKAGAFMQECPMPSSPGPLDVSFLRCFPTSGTDGTNLSEISSSEDGVIWTDHETSILIVRCVNDIRRDYKLLTLGPTVTDQVMATVQEKIFGMGFNSTLMSTMTYN